MKKLLVLIGASFFVMALFYAVRTGPVGSQPEGSTSEIVSSPPLTQPATAPPVTLGRPLSPSLGETMILHRIVGGDAEVFKLPSEQVEAFLQKNKRNAESLLAAFNVSADPELLREAVRSYPSNALVLAFALGSDASPEERRERIDRLKQIANDNSLPNYLSAGEYLKNHQLKEAFQELSEATAKTRFSDYTTERAQGLEELYLSAGHSISEAKALSTFGVQEPTLPALRDLAHELSTLENQYAAAGDTASVGAIAKFGLGLASDIKNAGTKSLGTQMLGASAEQSFLKGLDPTVKYDFVNQPIGERLAQLQEDRRNVLDDSTLLNKWMTTATEPQLVSYFDRTRLYGEAAALKWVRTQTNPE